MCPPSPLGLAAKPRRHLSMSKHENTLIVRQGPEETK